MQRGEVRVERGETKDKPEEKCSKHKTFKRLGERKVSK